jgi:hypothetical protein
MGFFQGQDYSLALLYGNPSTSEQSSDSAKAEEHNKGYEVNQE